MLTRTLRAGALVALTCTLAAPAFAHAHLKAAAPVADSAGPAPKALTLTFSEGVNPAFSGVKVTGVGGSSIDTGPGTSGPGGTATLVVPVETPLAPGRYTVEWHALAADGHKTSGRYSFTVAP